MGHQLLIWLLGAPPVMQPITDTASHNSGGRHCDGLTDTNHHHQQHQSPTVKLAFFLQMCHGWSLAQHHAGMRSRAEMWSRGHQEEQHHGGTAGAGQDLRQQHHLLLLCHLRLPMQLPHAQPVRSCHHGQLWLPHQRQFYPGCPPSGRVYQDLGRIRSKCWVSFKCLHHLFHLYNLKFMFEI